MNTITPESTPEELLRFLLGISSPATPNSVLDAIEKLPSGDSTQTFGKLCLLAAGPSSRRVLKEFVNTNNIILDDYWIANNDLNITKLAIAGHLFFLLPPEELTSLGVNVMKEYRRSLGGSKNIIEFGRNGSLLGNKWRTDILKRYAGKLENADVGRVRKVYGEKFTSLVKRRFQYFGWLTTSPHVKEWFFGWLGFLALVALLFVASFLSSCLSGYSK